MRRIRSATVVLLLCVAALSIGCSRRSDDAPPVASATVTLTPTDAAVGSPIDMRYRFVMAGNAPPFTENYLVFVHVVDEDGELMWTDDHQPPTPTREWKPGAPIEYVRTMFVPKFPYVGNAHVEVGLYSSSGGDRLRLSGQSSGLRAYRVASFTMRLQSDNVFVVFKDGWHDTETAESTAGLEWQWTKKMATLSFRNPKRDVVMLLECDEPVKVWAEPQRVEVRLPSGVVDSFALPSGRRELRRIPLTAGALGTGDTVEMTVAVDKTFVPANIGDLKSSDSRELGIRVFRAYIQAGQK